MRIVSKQTSAFAGPHRPTIVNIATEIISDFAMLCWRQAKAAPCKYGRVVAAPPAEELDLAVRIGQFSWTETLSSFPENGKGT